MNAKVEKAINDQINAELYSSYLYLAMAGWFESKGLKGFSNWMKVQAQEELFHAMKFFGYVCERGGRVTLAQIATPPKDWKSPLEVFQQAYAHEQKVTALIGAIVDLAVAEKDHMANNMLQWFVNEQVEEEANTSGIAQQLEMAGDAKSNLFMLDRELAARTFVYPPVAGGAAADAQA